MILKLVLTLLIAFALSVIMGRQCIPLLMRAKLGQKILEIGPRWHKSKEGTPTLGGIFFIIPALAALLIVYLPEVEGAKQLLPFKIMLFGILFALIGFVDDFFKLFKKRNKGLSARAKLLLQFVVSSLFLFFTKDDGLYTTAVKIPLAGFSLDLGIFFWAFALLFISFTSNATNLTDGVDGLLGSVSVIVAAFFLTIVFRAEDLGMSVLTVALIGGLLGYLVYNFYPAKVFMGDTGSLFLGGMFAMLAFCADAVLCFIFCGIIFFIVALSVIIQVASFKLTGKRVFKMAPIHHHFELCGWSEIKIVSVASVITAVTGAVCVFLVNL